MCPKLRSITFEGSLSETPTISNLVVLLSTLQNPQQLLRIRLLASNFSFLDFAAHSSSQLEVWRQLDNLLCGLCPQSQKEDDPGPSLTFQVASRKAGVPLIQSGRLLGLLPKFSRVGTCEEVEV